MSNYLPAGYSDDDDDSDEFEFSTDFDYRNQRIVQEIPETDENRFYTALKNEDFTVMKIMLMNGFLVDQPLCGGWSALMYASSFCSLEVIEFLIEAGANVNFNKDLFSPLMALSKSSEVDEDKILKCFNVFIKHDVNVNATDRNACTALMYACSCCHTELVRALVNCSCDVNIQDIEGWSALFHAVNEGQEDIVRILLDANARVDLIDRRRRSSMDLALQKGYDNLAMLVCSKKEKRKLLQEIKDDYIPEKIVMDPVAELLAQLPKNNAKHISGYSSDVKKLLWAMGLGHFTNQFSANNVQLNELLLITDERLKEFGVRFSVHRRHILNSIRKFHLHQWNKASLGLKPRNEQMTVLDGVRLLYNITKHLHIMDATLNYIRIHQPLPFQNDIFQKCENAVHQLNLINGECAAILSFSSQLKKREQIEPVDLIKPRNESTHNYVVPVLVTTFICFVLYKRDKLQPISNMVSLVCTRM